MNKLAVLAFAVLVSLSSMLWYLANGSLNEYLKSQIELQGLYYADQKTNIDLTNFSPSTGSGEFSNLSLVNIEGYQAKHVISIDRAHVALLSQPSQPLLTTVKEIVINKLIINSELNSNSKSNIDQLIERVRNQLAHDYPELYPDISAKIYAIKNPQLNAEEYAQNNPQAGPIIEHKKPKKKRGKAKGKINIYGLKINSLELNTMNNGLSTKRVLNNVKISLIGGKEGIETNQLGGEILLAILNLTTKS